jgi:hypothetical protein
MTPNGKLQAGDMIEDTGNGDRAIVVKVGRSSCYSIVVVKRSRPAEHTLITEVPFYLDNGRLRWINRKPENVGWAKAYCKSVLVPDV